MSGRGGHAELDRTTRRIPEAPYRLCRDCYADLSDRGNNALRCVPCAAAWSAERDRANKRRQRERHPDAVHAAARKDYAKHRDSRLARQRAHAAEHREEQRAYNRVYAAEHRDEINEDQRARRAAERAAAARPPRLCADCGVDIESRGPNARRCEPCAKTRKMVITTRSHAVLIADARAARPARLCADCGADISHRHGLARFCEPCAAARDAEQQREGQRRWQARHPAAAAAADRENYAKHRDARMVYAREYNRRKAAEKRAAEPPAAT